MKGGKQEKDKKRKEGGREMRSELREEKRGEATKEGGECNKKIKKIF